MKIAVLTLAFSLMILIFSPGTRAETQDGPRKDLIKELRLQSVSPLGARSASMKGTDVKSNPLRGYLVPLKKGLIAFIDCTPPPHQDGLTPEDAGTNYRAVIGFHFSLK